MMNENLYYAVKDEMNKRIPYGDMDYRNGIVALIMAKGHADKLTKDWVTKVLLGDVEDGFITYGQAVYIKDKFYEAICEVKKIHMTLSIG